MCEMLDDTESSMNLLVEFKIEKACYMNASRCAFPMRLDTFVQSPHFCMYDIILTWRASVDSSNNRTASDEMISYSNDEFKAGLLDTNFVVCHDLSAIQSEAGLRFLTFASLLLSTVALHRSPDSVYQFRSDVAP